MSWVVRAGTAIVEARFAEHAGATVDVVAGMVEVVAGAVVVDVEVVVFASVAFAAVDRSASPLARRLMKTVTATASR
jgi:hypothetical protein